MRAVRINAPGELRLVNVPAPSPAPDDIVVAVAFSGICGSDVDIYSGRRPQDFVRYPVVPGHEWSGTVAAVGESVDNGLLGRKVVGEGFRSCLSCGPCNRGESGLCDARYEEIGFTRPGAWARFLVLPAQQVHTLDNGANLKSAACLEPAACAADIVHRAAVRPGDRVAVVGAGTIGALTVQFLHGLEPSELIVVEPDSRASAMARRCGATDTVDPIAAVGLAGRFDVVIEAAGAASTPQLCLDLARRGGRLVLAGIPDAAAALQVRELVMKRVEIHTVFGAPSSAWRAAVEAFAAGTIDPGVLVTNEFDLADAGKALALLSARSPGVGKILLRP
jgi:2-desacetyl-2-hydroxyethyl bacteriochlorophyllide A dehydrogenase